MARWNALAEFLLNVIELLFLSLTIEALQGKMCQNSLLSGGVGQFEPTFQGEAVVPRGSCLFDRKLDTFCYLSVKTASSFIQSF